MKAVVGLNLNRWSISGVMALFILTGCVSSPNDSAGIKGMYKSRILDPQNNPIVDPGYSGGGQGYMLVFQQDSLKYYICRYTIAKNALRSTVDTARFLTGDAGVFSASAGILKATFTLHGKVDSVPDGNYSLDSLKFKEADLIGKFQSGMTLSGNQLKLDLFGTDWKNPVVLEKSASVYPY
jgi:hypothetical protein